jgi:hypothetical protein
MSSLSYTGESVIVFGMGVCLEFVPRRLDGHGSEALRTGRTRAERSGDCLVLSAGDAVTAKKGDGVKVGCCD